jgi:site-specific DNA-adenine methylase
MKTTTTNLFATATKVKETTKKTDKKVIISPILGNKVQKYAELKQMIDSATGELKMIEGDIKSVGKDLFMKEYRSQRSTPDNFKIQDDTGNACMFICMDKYTIVDEGKANILGQFDGLLVENVVYKFNADLVEKYGAVLSELILNCPDIDDLDKGNLITGEKTFSVAKGSIDRLMQYDNPEQVFELINPIVALKK